MLRIIKTYILGKRMPNINNQLPYRMRKLFLFFVVTSLLKKEQAAINMKREAPPWPLNVIL